MSEIYLQELEDFLREHLRERAQEAPAEARALGDAMAYSLNSGGKRFRPTLSYLTAEAVGCGPQRITPFAAAIECIHTYSLIHDDLPAMDDDNERRGQPTSHRVFGEANAILAGDALLTEAFQILAANYTDVPEIGLELTGLLSRAAGATGMVAGQIMDIALLESSSATPDLKALLKMHELKTGALICCAVEGVAVVARASPDERKALKSFGQALGMAFQLADDLLDHDPKAAELSGFPRWIGVKETEALLKRTTDQALSQIAGFGPKAQGLRQLLQYNLQRKK